MKTYTFVAVHVQVRRRRPDFKRGVVRADSEAEANTIIRRHPLCRNVATVVVVELPANTVEIISA